MKLYSTILISTCCECKRHYGVKDAQGADGGISHGLCKKCLEKALRKIRER